MFKKAKHGIAARLLSITLVLTMMFPMKTNKDVIYRSIAGEQILIPVGSVAMENNGMFVMTELGGEIWQMLEQGLGKEEMITKLLAEYEVEEDVLRADVEEYLKKLLEGGLITE